jgi:hypothetical protein
VKLTFLENFDSCEDIITVISTALAFVLQGFFEKKPSRNKKPFPEGRDYNDYSSFRINLQELAP